MSLISAILPPLNGRFGLVASAAQVWRYPVATTATWFLVGAATHSAYAGALDWHSQLLAGVDTGKIAVNQIVFVTLKPK
jgi:hypothetical protein